MATAVEQRADDGRLPDWKSFAFVDQEGRRHRFYRRGEGPGVVVIHEIPGITPEVRGFGELLAARGYTVVMPVLFGSPGKDRSGLYSFCQLARACVSREFVTLLTNRTSAATIWLRQLARSLHDDVGGPGVGVVGMCISGGFALAMVLEESVIAPVLSQPSLPLALLAPQRADVNLSAGDRTEIRRRVEDEDLTVLGLRFTADWRVPAQRFAALRELLGPRFVEHSIESGDGTPFPSGAHSVLTYADARRSQGLLDAAVDEVTALFERTLRP